MEVKIKARKVELDFFRNLSFKGDGATDNDAKGSIPFSLASKPSMRGSQVLRDQAQVIRPSQRRWQPVGPDKRVEDVILKLINLPALKSCTSSARS